MQRMLTDAAFLFLSGSCVLAEDVNIVASFYPVYIFAQNILKDIPGVSLSCMTAPSTGCLHDYQLLTGDMRLLARADALLINGAGMESFLPVPPAFHKPAEEPVAKSVLQNHVAEVQHPPLDGGKNYLNQQACHHDADI